MFRLNVVLAALFLFSSTSNLKAQQLNVPDGVKVRIMSRGNSLSGVVATSTADSIMIFSGKNAELLGVYRPSIERLEISRGRSIRKGAQRGMLIGTVVLGPVFYYEMTKDLCGAGCEGFKTAAGAFALVGGAAWGALGGAVIRREVWETIYIDPRLTLGPNSIGISISIPGVH